MLGVESAGAAAVEKAAVGLVKRDITEGRGRGGGCCCNRQSENANAVSLKAIKNRFRARPDDNHFYIQNIKIVLAKAAIIYYFRNKKTDDFSSATFKKS